ncbi:RNA-guided endonuclease TnpB family protein [Mycobacterium sp.]|uniref:RNA-guided endonuclease InsQ/TnpB family protein n=1 Tax=Mycobacterium sp. TaxID=1785 RepID=UPI00333E8488|nr:transposase [Mycobacterium sp.]
MLTGEMTRHTTFRFCLDPTVEQHDVLARHAGASRFAFNECLGMVKTALTERKTSPDVPVPWTGFDLINAFNAWKKTEDAGRVFAVDADGVTEIVVTGLAWRTEVCQQVFEEAVVDLGKGLKSWSDSRSGKRTGKRVGFPRFKKKTSAVPSFRLRNKHPKGRPSAIRVGDNNRPRSVTLPGIGPIAIHDDTRRLRRMLANNRAKILFATITHHGGHWWVSLNIEAADLHPGRQHRLRSDDDTGGDWIGVDRGLSAFAVAATSTGTEVARINDAPKALHAGMKRQQRLAKSLSRKRKGSVNRHDAARKLGRHHQHVANVRRYFLHQVSNELVKTHDRLVIEDLNVSGMLANHSLARAISDAGWAEFARLLRYKQAWRGGQLVVADRWYPSSRLCPLCGSVRSDMTLADRVFACGCGHSADRDTNAAVNLARWGHAHHDASRSPDPQAGGRATNARRQDGADQYPSCAGETSLDDAGTDVHTAPAA